MKLLLTVCVSVVVLFASNEARRRGDSVVHYQLTEPYLESSLESLELGDWHEGYGNDLCYGGDCHQKKRYAMAYLISQAAVASYFFLKALLCAIFATCTSYPTVTATTSITVTNTLTTTTTTPTTTTTRTSTTTPSTRTTTRRTRSTTILPTTFTSVSTLRFRESTTQFPTTTTTTTGTTPITVTVTPVSTTVTVTVTTSTETRIQSNNGNGRRDISLNDDYWADILNPDDPDISDGVTISPTAVIGVQLFTAEPTVNWEVDNYSED